MSNSDPSHLSYPVLPTSSLDDTQTQSSLIDFQSPTIPPQSDVFTGEIQQVTPPTIPSQMYSGGAIQANPTLPTTNSVHSQHSALHSMRNTTTQESKVAADTQSLKLQHFEQLCSKLHREKSELMVEFGKQRKKFIEKLSELERERTLLANTNEKYGVEMREISTQLLSIDEELNNVRLAAKMSEKQMREDFDRDRVKYEEEIASLGQIIAVQSQDQSAAFSQERDGWKRERDGMLAEIQRLRTYPTPQYTQPRTYPTPQYTQPPPHVPVSQPEATPIRNTPSQSPDANLDYDMAKAALDVKVLRSVVVPLEEEIDVLKVKLSQAEEKLAEYESQPPPTEDTTPLIEFDTPVSTPTTRDNDTLQAQLKLERAARQDLEMHTEALVAQKTLTHQEILVLTQEVEKFKDKYKAELTEHNALKSEYAALKKTWELANQHFVDSQKSLEQKIFTLSKQLETVSTSNRGTNDTSEGAGGIVVQDVKVKSVPCSSPKRCQSSEGEDIIIPTGVLERRLSVSLPLLDQMSGDASFETEAHVETNFTELANENEKLRGELVTKNKACLDYESQLHRVQNQMVEELDGKERDIDRLRAETEKLKAGIVRERETQKALRRTIQEEMEQIKAKMETFRETEKKLRLDIKRRKDNFTELKHDTQEEIARLMEDKKEYRTQLESAREEYDCLKVLQSQQVSDFQQSLSKEKVARKEAETNVKGIKSQMSAVQARLQSTEEDLCAQLTLVKEQLLAETQQKEKLTAELTSQLANSLRQNDGLQSLKVDIETEKKAKEEALSSKHSIQEKSTTFIQQQQREIEKLHKEKEVKDKHIFDLTRQLSSLKHQLDRSSETQKDFVELSQSLQIRLAEMEESQQSNTSLTDSSS